MNTRKTPLITGEMYHVFNRSVARQPIFDNDRMKNRFLKLIEFYRLCDPPMRFSYFNRLPRDRKKELQNTIDAAKELFVEILAFAIMPNHFHLLLKQVKENGISRFLSQIQNSFAKFFNTDSERSGSAFQQEFKNVHIETENQMVHTIRYIHLNPLTSYVIKSPNELDSYQWTSFPDYLAREPRTIINTQPLKSLFASNEKFKQHTLDQTDYQRSLKLIEHLTFD